MVLRTSGRVGSRRFTESLEIAISRGFFFVSVREREIILLNKLACALGKSNEKIRISVCPSGWFSYLWKIESKRIFFLINQMNMKTHIFHFLRAICLGGLLSASAFCVQAENIVYVPTPENLQARKEFQDNKFGIFLHWGIYSMFGQGEWYMNNDNIDCHEYAKVASGFYPSRFDAHEWVAAIKASGARYICITSRHHEGFSMFHTKYSDYNVVDATPFKRDVIKELAEECQKQGIKLHLYYSHLDWTREDYYPLGRTGHGTGRTSHGEWATYYEFMNHQLTELLTNYGPIGAIWFDGMWDQPDGFDWKLDEQYALIHKLQPACLIGNNHHKAPYPGEDFQMFERDLPGENKAGFSGESVVGRLPLETCETMNGMWGYQIKDQNYKSVTELVRLLVRAAGKGANLLMNIGPQPNGELPAVAVERLRGVGKWMSENGDTIYGTAAGNVMTASWGTTTRKGNMLYVHLLTDEMPQFVTLPLTEKVLSSNVFHTGEKVKWEKIQGGIVLHTENLEPSVDCIVALKLKE